MSRSFHPRKRTPPKRRCMECGGDVYAWTEHALCRRPECVEARKPDPDAEPIRVYLRRVGRMSPLIEPDGGDQ